MNYGMVTTNVLDMRREPDHHAERVNQVLFGEVVTWSKRKAGFAYVSRYDGYRGWADIRFIKPLSAARAKSFERQADSVMVSLHAGLNSEAGESLPPHVVYYGTRFVRQKTHGNQTSVLTPDGAEWRLKSAAVRPIIREKGRLITGADLIAEAKKFLGVPYLWGGITAAGLDCSGLVQTVSHRLGMDIPRDTKDQIKFGEPVERERIKKGDLVFFRGHVGFAVDSSRLIHSSRGGGGVRIESLSSTDPDYREDLDRDYKGARRIV